MTHNASAELLQNLEANLSLLSQEERGSILALLDSLDDALSPEALNNQIAGFLNHHLEIERKLIPLLATDSVRLGGTPPTHNAKEFKGMIRNIVLRPTTTPTQDGGTQAKR